MLKRVAEIVSKTNHRVEIWDSKAYKYRNKDVCSDNGDGPTEEGSPFFNKTREHKRIYQEQI